MKHIILLNNVTFVRGFIIFIWQFSFHTLANKFLLVLSYSFPVKSAAHEVFLSLCELFCFLVHLTEQLEMQIYKVNNDEIVRLSIISDAREEGLSPWLFLSLERICFGSLDSSHPAMRSSRVSGKLRACMRCLSHVKFVCLMREQKTAIWAGAPRACESKFAEINRGPHAPQWKRSSRLIFFPMAQIEAINTA